MAHTRRFLSALRSYSCVLFASFSLSGYSYASTQSIQQSDTYDPERGTQLSLNQSDALKTGIFDSAIVVTANPYATQAGLEILKLGGNAIDAMVAVQLVLGLVEPQSSGLGGGAFTLLYDAKKKSVRTFDGRETAPQKAPVDLFLKPDQTPMAFFDAVVGGRSVGTPGTVALLWHLHEENGALPWAKLFNTAKQLAKDGFVVSPRLAESVARDKKRLSSNAETAAYFLPGDTPIQSGTKLKNPKYLATLNLLAEKGAKHFYSSEFAAPIIEKVRNATNAGYLSQEDFDNYQVIERDPICTEIFAHSVCGMGPPSSGALTVHQTLRLVELSMPEGTEPETALAWHIVAEASRRAFADRNRYMADTDFVDMPDWLLKPEYLKERAAEINPDKYSSSVEPGFYSSPDGSVSQLIDGIELEQPSTTHFVIVDKAGNVISSTSTIENGFGSRLMVHGFLLNNELTDFSFSQKDEHGFIANRVEPGKRPRSSMAPTIVLKDGEPVLAIGSPGGSRIINYVANSLLRSLAWKQDIRDVVNASHFSNRSGVMDIESSGIPPITIKNLQAIGYQVNQRDLNSGIHAVAWRQGKLLGAADPRREGTVAGY